MPPLRLIILLPLFLGGCATLSKDECLRGDWFRIGYHDGLDGMEVNRLQFHNKACAEYGVTPDSETYYNGRSQGLLKYCEPASAFRVGREGKVENAASCPPDMQQAFLREYEKGQDIHRIESDIASTRIRIESNLSRIDAISNRIDVLNRELRRTDLTNDTRNKLLDEYNRLLNDKNNLTLDIDHLRRDMDLQYDLLQLHLRTFGLSR